MNDKTNGKSVKEGNNNYWRSFKELHNDPVFEEIKKNEFPEGAENSPDLDKMSGMSRRRFLALMGASAALAGTACSPYNDHGNIMPYVKGQEGLLPGIANYYASTYNFAGQSFGILVKTREGRPIKVDGNPDHPFNRGKIPAQIQASIMDLYDPTRFKKPLRQKEASLSFYKNVYEEISWSEADSSLIEKFEKAVAAGKEIAIVTNTIVSPTAKKVLDAFMTKYPTAKIYSYELFHQLNRQGAWEKCYNSKNRPPVNFDKADVILSIDADFLGNDPNSMAYIRQFTSRKEAIKGFDFNRLYHVDAGFSQTAISADYRIKLSPQFYYNFLMSLANELVNVRKIAANFNSNITSKLNAFNLKAFASDHGLKMAVLKNLVDDLFSSGKKALVYAGDEQSEEIHIITNFINDLLGSSAAYNDDRAHVEYVPLSQDAEFAVLTKAMADGNIGAVIHLDSNPVYHLNAEINYSKALENVETVVTMAALETETANLSNYILPLHHTLESWGDASTYQGVYSLQQPVIEPIYETRQAEGMFLTWSKADPAVYSDKLYHNYLMANWKKTVYAESKVSGNFERFWFKSLHDGVTVNRVKAEKISSFSMGAFLGTTPPKTEAGYTLILKPSYAVADGRFAHNGWMQELPHPVSKVSWDNYAAVSLATSQKLDVNNDDMVNVTVGETTMKLPVFVQPGLTDDAIVVEMGWGRKLAGPVGSNGGFDVNPLRTKTAALSQWIMTGAKIEKTDGYYELASTQEHHVIDLEHIAELIEERELVQDISIEDYKKNPNLIQDKRHHIFSITDEWKYEGVKWGMAIDMNKCIGCSICTTSCNVENNIPVVGKDQVALGREMNWLRIDRYYSGTAEEPKAALQPMLCQQCDNAPCENVCPVAATVHSPDGLNDMSYNRCVGTRYCANNCPYKVRRFNFFNFRDHVANGFYQADSTEFMHNPEVTVRSRGVMEKCTFCVQRISEEKEVARKEQRDVDGSRVVVACQEACPANAIVFGDINQENGELRQYRDHKLGYHVLEETNVKPNVTYITKLRNTHTEESA